MLKAVGMALQKICICLLCSICNNLGGIIKDNEDFVEADALSSSGDEEVSSEDGHKRLIHAVQALDKTDGSIDTDRRTEPALQVSDFHVGSSTEKAKLHHLVATLKTGGKHGELKKQLNRVQKKQQVLETPLPKVEKERIERGLAYGKTTKEVSKWDPVVAKNRQADQLKFPLERPDIRLHTTTQQLVQKFQPRTPLELEVAALLRGNKAVLGDQKMLTPAEESALKAMSLEEAKERRAELQKHRALLSYQEAKARRRNKIKSKRFHRMLKKEQKKKEQKALSDLEKNDPEAYAEEVMSVDKQRIKERMNLKHRGGSKFMKKQMIYGKYDDDARQSVQEMLQKSRELTEKRAAESGGEESDGLESLVGDEEEDDRQITPTDKIISSANPWMKSALSAKAKGAEYKKPPPVVSKSSEGDFSRDEGKFDKVQLESGPNVVTETKDKDANYVRDQSDCSSNDDDNDDDDDAVDDEDEIEEEEEKGFSNTNNRLTPSSTHKQKNLSHHTAFQKQESNPDAAEFRDNNATSSSLAERLVRKKTLDDFDENISSSEDEDGHLNEPEANSRNSPEETPADVQVDPLKYMTVESVVQGSLAPVVAEVPEDEETDQRMTIAEAFSADDVVEEFKEEKKEIETRDKPKDIDLTLPGWGDWGGSGIHNKKKRKRFLIKAPPAPPRKDATLDNVIISETKDRAVTKYQVNELPFPYTNVATFENSIRQPIGKTWNPETAFKKLVKPKVVSRLGTVIEPIDKQSTFKNKREFEGERGSQKQQKKRKKSKNN